MLMIGHPGQHQHATQEARFSGGFIFNRLCARKWRHIPVPWKALNSSALSRGLLRKVRAT
jgi:hypothetical protein